MIVCAAIAAHSQTLNTITTFDVTNGALPWNAALTQGVDGNLYGTTQSGGLTNEGTVFKVSLPGGALTTIYNFCAQANCADGLEPYAGLVLATDGNFYGTTWIGGASGPGTVFRITPQGALTTIYSFCTQPNCSDGGFPEAALIEGSDGNLYGTTSAGGNAGCANGGCGVAFRISLSGEMTILYSFCNLQNCADGSFPVGGLIQATDGNFYGTTSTGGLFHDGTVFRITQNGQFSTLYNFKAYSGASPRAGLIQGADGNLYGATAGGGGPGCNAAACGTIFKITPSGSFAKLFSFDGGSDGGLASGGLIQAMDGNLYGTTQAGGFQNDGTIFQITTAGALTSLHSFDFDDGAFPQSSLLQGTSGAFYGMTNDGGENCIDSSEGCGTIFKLSTDLGPFVAFVRNLGKVGQSAGILGQGFTGATSVSFNGIPAAFIVRRDTFLTATVPAGATTGYVTVTTPTGTLTSNVKFNVLP